jgi:hypothetical protein
MAIEKKEPGAGRSPQPPKAAPLPRPPARPSAPRPPLAGPPAALVAFPLAAALAGRLIKTSWTANFGLWAMAAIAVALSVLAAWPALGRVLLAYACAARVPVLIVMAVAIGRGLGTHYDAPPPGFPDMTLFRRWLWIGLLPQSTIWVAWTMATGALGGALGWQAASRRPR